MDINEEDFDTIADGFLVTQNSDELHKQLVHKVQNQVGLVRIIWFANATTQVYFIQKPHHYKPFEKNTWLPHVYKSSRELDDATFYHKSFIKRLCQSPGDVSAKQSSLFNQYSLDNFESLFDLDLEKHRRYLKFYRMNRLFGEDLHYSSCPVRVHLLHAIYFIMIIFFVILTVDHLQYKISYEISNPHLESHNHDDFNKSIDYARCVNPYEIKYNFSSKEHFGYLHIRPEGTFPDYLSDVQNLKKVHNHELFKTTGYLAITKCGLFSYLMVMMVILVLGLYLSAWACYDTVIYIDSLSFYLSPVEERMRTMKRLLEIVFDLYNPADVEQDQQPGEKREIESDFGLRRPTTPSLFVNGLRDDAQFARGDPAPDTQSAVDCYCLSDSERRRKLVDLIFKHGLIRSVKPNLMDTNLHDKQTIVYSITQVTFTLTLTFFGVPMACVVPYHEMLMRGKLRKAILRCKLFYNNATILRDPYEMWFDPINETLLSVYGFNNLDLSFASNRTMQSDTSMNQFQPNWNQMWFEFRQFINRRLIGYSAFIVTSYVMVAMWMFEYTFLFVDGWIFQDSWVKQLQSQLNDCNTLLDHLYHLNLASTSAEQSEPCGWHQRFKFNAGAPACSCVAAKLFRKRWEKVECALIITYLNLQLFRKSYKHFRQICNFTLFQLIPVSLSNSVISYYWLIWPPVKFQPSDVWIFWFINFSYSALLNYYVTICVHLLNNIQKLFKSIALINFKLTLNKMELSYVAELWQRQLMNESEINNQFCVQVWGKNFSLATLIAVDSYIFAVWLMFGRYMILNRQDSENLTV